MDSFASLALATEPPDKVRLLGRAPQGRNEYIVSQCMMKHILIMSLYQCIVMYTIVFAGEFFIPESANYIPQKNGMIVSGRPYNWDGSKNWVNY
jgi:magnesium-transporting ATPase (P-type)